MSEHLENSHRALLRAVEALCEKVESQDVRITKLEKSTSLFHETPKVPEGWCQICGMKKADCIHAKE